MCRLAASLLLLPLLLLGACVTSDNEPSDETFRNTEEAYRLGRYDTAWRGAEKVLASNPAPMRRAEALLIRCMSQGELNLPQAPAACEEARRDTAGGSTTTRLRYIYVKSTGMLLYRETMGRQPQAAVAESRAIGENFGRDPNPALRHAAARVQLIGIGLLIQRNQDAEAQAWLTQIEENGWLEPAGLRSSGDSAVLATEVPYYALYLANRQGSHAALVVAAEKYRRLLQAGNEIIRTDIATMLLLPVAYGRMMQRDQPGMDAALTTFLAEIEAIPSAMRPGMHGSAVRPASLWAGHLVYQGLPPATRERMEKSGAGLAYFNAGINAMQNGEQQKAAEHLDRVAEVLRQEQDPAVIPSATLLADRLVRVRRALLLQASPPPTTRMQG